MKKLLFGIIGNQFLTLYLQFYTIIGLKNIKLMLNINYSKRKITR